MLYTAFNSSIHSFTFREDCSSITPFYDYPETFYTLLHFQSKKARGKPSGGGSLTEDKKSGKYIWWTIID